MASIKSLNTIIIGYSTHLIFVLSKHSVFWQILRKKQNHVRVRVACKANVRHFSWRRNWVWGC